MRSKQWYTKVSRLPNSLPKVSRGPLLVLVLTTRGSDRGLLEIQPSGGEGGAGIRVHGNPGLGEVIARAIVADNDVTMSAPEGTVFGANSAGIEIIGCAQGNVVLNNRIRGRARAALSVAAQGMGISGNNTFVLNDLGGFQSSLADVFVGAGVTNTLVVGMQATVEDHGTGTFIVPTPF